jgi:hypothetical protein
MRYVRWILRAGLMLVTSAFALIGGAAAAFAYHGSSYEVHRQGSVVASGGGGSDLVGSLVTVGLAIVLAVVAMRVTQTLARSRRPRLGEVA